MSRQHAEHGGAFFEAIGVGLDHLENRSRVVNADVLDAWYDPAPGVVAAISEHLPWLIRTSPPTHSEGLQMAISQARGLPEECVVVGSGSSSLIFTAFPRLLPRGAKVLLLDPSYGEYGHLLRQVLQAEVTRHELEPVKGFTPDLDILSAQARGQDMVILVNPNSPTGVGVSRQFVADLLATLDVNTRLWVDETYTDFCEASCSVEALVGTDQRLIVAKSMSKYYALSGVRVGYLAAHPDVADLLDELTPPWAVGLISQLAAVSALADPQYYRDRAAETTELRGALASELSAIEGVKAFPSVANFLLLELDFVSSKQLVERARAEGVFLRNCDSMGAQMAERFVRVAVKDRSANEKIVAAVRNGMRHG